MADFDVDAALEGVAAQVRKAIADAEARATEIIRAAEREAEGIRARAEAEARDQVEGARRALEELTTRFGTGAAPSPPPPPEPAQPPPAAPPPAEPAQPAAAAAPPASEPQTPPTGAPAADAAADDTQAARLVAMKMALDGATREAIEAELERSYTLPDRGALLDDVLARVAK